jgi:hypothetical protein
MANEIEFDIVARLEGVEKSLKKLEGSAKETGEQLNKSIADGFEKNAKAAFSNIAKAAAVAGAAIIAGFGVALASSIQAASEEEEAINKLNQSLASAGTFSEQASQDILNFASQLQATTTIADDAAIGLVALSRNFARSNEEAVKLTQAAVELSAATGIGLEQAVEGLGKTLSGQAGKLAQTVPALRGLSEEALKSGAALDAVIGRFGGSAAAQVNTFQGAFLQLKNTFGDLQESIGNVIVKSPGLVAAFKFISKFIQDLTSSLNTLGASNEDVFGKFLGKVVDVTNFLVGIFGPIIEVTINRIGQMARALGALAAAFVQLVSGEFRAAAETFKEGVLVEVFDLNDEALNLSATNSAKTFLNGLSDAISKAPPVSLLPKNNPPGDQLAENIDPLKNPALGISFNNLRTAFGQSATSIKLTAFDLATSLKQSFVSGFTNSFQSFGSALAKGENAFAAFGKSILSSLGQLLIQFGSTMVAIGLSLSTVPFLFGLQGPAAVAAGAAAIVLGGVLTALGGGGGGGASAPAASSGGGVAGAGFQSPIGDNATAFQETEQTQGTQVAVNINGNVLGDKRTLGIAVAEAINEAFGSDGAVIARGALA